MGEYRNENLVQILSDSNKIAILVRKNVEKRGLYRNENWVKILSDSYKCLF